MLGLYNQYPEHLAPAQLFFPGGLSGQMALHLFRCQYAQRMRRVAERIGELFRKRDVGDGGGKTVQHDAKNPWKLPLLCFQ